MARSRLRTPPIHLHQHRVATWTRLLLGCDVTAHRRPAVSVILEKLSRTRRPTNTPLSPSESARLLQTTRAKRKTLSQREHAKTLRICGARRTLARSRASAAAVLSCSIGLALESGRCDGWTSNLNRQKKNNKLKYLAFAYLAIGTERHCLGGVAVHRSIMHEEAVEASALAARANHCPVLWQWYACLQRLITRGSQAR